MSSSAPWDDFCAGLLQAGGDFLAPEYPSDQAERAEGSRHLAELLEQALHWNLSTDPDFPRFVSLNDTFELADNRLAPVRGGATYRLTGDVSTLFDVNISLHEGWPFLGETGVWGDIGLDDLDVDPDGRFELVVGPEPRDGNWLELPPEATMLHVREYFADWDLHRPGTFEIVRLGSEGQAPRRRDDDDLARRLREVLRYVRGYTPSHLRMINALRAEPANVVQPPSRQRGGNRNIAYAFGRFDLDPEEALVLEFAEPDARLWGVQWLTIPWYENPDLANRFTSVVGHDAFVNADGRVRIVVSAADPGVPNWLDVGGYSQGVIAARWIWGTDDGPAMVPSVVKSIGVRDAVPPDTPVVDAAARAAMQARRRSHFARRRR